MRGGTLPKAPIPLHYAQSEDASCTAYGAAGQSRSSVTEAPVVELSVEKSCVWDCFFFCPCFFPGGGGAVVWGVGGRYAIESAYHGHVFSTALRTHYVTQRPELQQLTVPARLFSRGAMIKEKRKRCRSLLFGETLYGETLVWNKLCLLAGIVQFKVAGYSAPNGFYSPEATSTADGMNSELPSSDTVAPRLT